MRRVLPFAAAALLAAAACLRTKPSVPDAGAAREDFLAGVEALLNRDDDAAARDWARCLRKAAKGSEEESDCRLFSSMLQERLAPKAPAPDENGAARRAYLAGREDYLRGDLAGADRLWHECLAASDRDPASRPDCLMALELISARRRSAAADRKSPSPAPPPADAPLSAQQAYLEGVIYYQKGDYLTARDRWESCAAQNSDCRAGLDRIEQLLNPPAP